MEIYYGALKAFLCNRLSGFIISRWVRLKRFLFSGFFRCDLCALETNQYRLLCRTCANDLSLFSSNLPADLLQIPTVYRQLPQIVFHHLYAMAPYHWPFDRWIKELKYQQRAEIAPLLATLLADMINTRIPKQAWPTLLVAVPVHGHRLKQRLYNQSALIAAPLAQSLAIDYQEQAFKRIKNSDSQVGQSGAQRRRNLKGNFILTTKEALPAHVAIVDDVLTTGATVSELAKLLIQRGVKKVSVFTVCVALK